MKIIDADVKIAELRGKLARYAVEEQTEEVVFKIRAIKGCIAELRAARPYEGGEVVHTVVHRDEQIVRCGKCEFHLNEMECQHPDGMIVAPPDGFCVYGKEVTT